MQKTVKQPVSKITWLHRDELSPNLYNPNHVFKPEMELLKESILSDGWLFPIVVLDKSIHLTGLTDNEGRNKYTIIDGFHRHKTSGDKDVYTLTDGLVPCIILNPANPMATTVRLNRAKGTHAVLKMAEIIQKQLELGKSMPEMCKEFGMEEEEVIRLANRAGIPKSTVIAQGTFGKAWQPK